MDDNMSEAGVEGEINQVGREPRTPRPILKLSEDVVNQIAAAEVRIFPFQMWPSVC